MNAITTGTDLRLIFPGDPGWDEARLAYNLTVDQRPALIAVPTDHHEVAAAVEYARENSLRVAAQRTGHNASPFDSLADTMLLRTDALQGVEIDAQGRIARVGSGAKWGDVVPAASEMGLAGLHGSTPGVSIAGYSLGGGLSWYGRKHGLQANSVTAIEIVTADGGHRRVDHDNEPELFWALRGGGGNFGVVTALEFELYPLTEVYAGVLFYPFEQAVDVLHTWRDMQAQMPDEMTAIVRVMPFPDIEDVPAPLRGRTWALIDAAFMGGEAEGVELLRPLRDLGPVMDTFAMVAPVGISELHMDPPEPVPYTSGHALLSELPSGAIDEAVAMLDPMAGGPPVGLEFRPTGGALGRSAAHHGALDRFPGDFLMFVLGFVPEPGMIGAARAGVDRVSAVFSPYETGHYLNFVEQKVDARTFYSDDTFSRLQAVKAEYDPENIFRANHEIAPKA
jgi:FAD/FMN-containing dehydrogenase